jgi:hypothetical protein
MDLLEMSMMKNGIFYIKELIKSSQKHSQMILVMKMVDRMLGD